MWRSGCFIFFPFWVLTGIPGQIHCSAMSFIDLWGTGKYVYNILGSSQSVTMHEQEHMTLNFM